MLAFSVEKSPPKAMPAASRARGKPSISALIIASAYRAEASAMAGKVSSGTIPTRNHWNVAFTANTINGERKSARGILI